MTKPFHPIVKEKKININVSGREADLLYKLRQYPFGRFTIHKMNNLLIRIEINNSELIEEEGGLAIRQ